VRELLASLVEVTTRMMNQTSWQVRAMNAGLRNLAIATCRFCTDPTVHLPHTYVNIRSNDLPKSESEGRRYDLQTGALALVAKFAIR